MMLRYVVVLTTYLNRGVIKSMFDRNNQRKSIPILMYHSISDDANPKFKPFTVTPALFAQHMAYLYRRAYTPITVTQLVNTFSHESARLPEKPVVLTFDD